MMNLEVVFKFLKDLAKHNDRAWFEKNKPKYLEAKDQFEEFISKALDAFVKIDESLAGLDPKKLTFRIYRDVRFSKDKRPYKTNMGASFSPAGKGMGAPGYYLHLEPGDKSFVAAGLFQPEPEKLAKVRQEIDYNGDQLIKIIGNKKLKKYFKDFWNEESLKTAPKGYAKDHPHVELLKHRHYIMMHTFTDKQVKDKKFLKHLVEVSKAVKPLNDFLTGAIA